MCLRPTAFEIALPSCFKPWTIVTHDGYDLKYALLTVAHARSFNKNQRMRAGRRGRHRVPPITKLYQPERCNGQGERGVESDGGNSNRQSWGGLQLCFETRKKNMKLMPTLSTDAAPTYAFYFPFLVKLAMILQLGLGA